MLHDGLVVQRYRLKPYFSDKYLICTTVTSNEILLAKVKTEAFVIPTKMRPRPCHKVLNSDVSGLDVKIMEATSCKL